MSTPLADCAPMAPLLAAFARGTRRSRLRQLVVACTAGHTLIEVFPTAAGPHAVWQRPHRPTADGLVVESWRVEWMAAPLVAPAAAWAAAERARRQPPEQSAAGAEFVTKRSWDSGRTEAGLDATEALYLDSTASCRCTKAAHVDGRQLTEWLAAGTRREILAI